MKERKKLREVADKFLNAVKEEVDSAVLLGDADRLGRLVTQFDILLGYEVLKTLRDKGLAQEITKLCDKAGRIEAKKALKEGRLP